MSTRTKEKLPPIPLQKNKMIAKLSTSRRPAPCCWSDVASTLFLVEGDVVIWHVSQVVKDCVSVQFDVAKGVRDYG